MTFTHMAEYHYLDNIIEKNKSYMLFISSKIGYAAFPFTLKDIKSDCDYENLNYFDISSVYGYPGPLSTVKIDDEDAPEFRIIFQDALKKIFDKFCIVSFFSRTNPFFPTSWLFTGMNEKIETSSSIVVNLTQDEEIQDKTIRKSYRYDIRKAIKNGVTVYEDFSFFHIDEFIKIYYETMNRNRAKRSYYFPKEYFIQLKNIFKDSIKLFFAIYDNKIISGSMFFFKKPIIHYHLSATPSQYLDLSGSKLIIDYVRKKGKRENYSWLHLGGGVRSSNDSLFKFKSGFSKNELDYITIRIIVNSKKYKEFVKSWKEKTKYIDSHQDDLSFFPLYRNSIV